MTDNINIPTIEDLDPSIELEDEFQDSPEFRAALRNAQVGQYEHTLFEMWEDILFEAKRQIDGVVTIPLANGLLRQWPWMSMKDIPKYFKVRTRLLDEALEVLYAQFPKDKTELYTENVDDWPRHRDYYLDVVVEWTKLVNLWSDRWEELPLTHSDKAIEMAAISDTTALIVNPSTGLAEQIQNLAGFTVDEETAAKMEARIRGLSDE